MTRRKTGSGIRMKERLQKLLSAAGVCSRRAAEGYITAGRVTVNGETALLGQQADPETDDIRVDGVPLGREPEAVYLMLNKPRGYVTTVSDEQGRKTVMDLLTGVSTRVYPVGRLDRDSEGLLLLTNDGALTHRLLHPSHEVSKEYRVTVSGPVEHAAERLSRIRDVVGLPIRPAEVRELSRKGNRRAERDHPRGTKPPDPADVRPVRAGGPAAPAGAGALSGAWDAAAGSVAVLNSGGDHGTERGMTAFRRKRQVLLHP